jgi:hypothetical protein
MVYEGSRDRNLANRSPCSSLRSLRRWCRRETGRTGKAINKFHMLSFAVVTPLAWPAGARDRMSSDRSRTLDDVLLVLLRECGFGNNNRDASQSDPDFPHVRFLGVINHHVRRRESLRRINTHRCRRRSSYSITLSTRASSSSDTMRPSSAAVWRLRTASNLVGLRTGMSAGFLP